MPQVKPKPQRTYSITAQLALEGTIEIEAESMEDAVGKSKALKVEDYVTLDPIELYDSSMRITNVYSLKTLPDLKEGA